MKYNYKIILLTLGLAMSQVGFGQLLNENFDYGSSSGTLTTMSSSNWTAHSGSGSSVVGYTTTGLSMANYASSGVGGAATVVGGSGTREDVNRTFTTQSSGTIYAATLINVSSTLNGDYTFHLRQSGGTFTGRVFTQDVGGKLRFGVSKASTSTINYSSTDFDYNTTYLLVLKYTFNSSTTSDDGVDIFVLSSVQYTEPSPLISYSDNTSADATNLNQVCLRQGSTTLTGTYDGIRVATSWSDLLPNLVDETAPTFITDYPNISNITGNGARLNVQLDEPGTVYYVLVLDEDGVGGSAPATPTAAQVKAGQNATGTPVALSGSQAIAEASVTVSKTITGLIGGSIYHAFVVAEDDESTPNVQSAPAEVIVQTTSWDTTAPEYQNSTPSVSGITDAQFSLTVRLNETGTAYYVVLANNAMAPSSAQVKAGQDASGAAAFKSGTINITMAYQDFSTLVTGLAASTPYDVYVVAEDDETTPNINGAPTSLDITTAMARDVNSNISPDPAFITNPLVLIPAGYTTEEFAYNTLTFQIQDLSTTDELPTEITQMVFTPGGGNTAAWATVLAGASIKFEGNKVNTVNPVITNGSITFDFSSNPFVISDGGTALLNLHVWLKTTGITDGQKLQFQVPAAHTWASAATGSGFATTVTGAAGNEYTLDVAGTVLEVVAPTSVLAGNTFSVTVTSKDVNGNVDNLVRQITLSVETGTGNLGGTLQKESANGVVTFDNLTYDTVEEIVLEAADNDNMVYGTDGVSVLSPLLFNDNFEYTNGTLLTANGWTAHSGAGTQSPTVTAGLSYTGYISSGIGGGALLDNTGEDVNRQFSAQTTGIVYLSFLVNVTSAVDGYFISLGNGTTNFAPRIFARASSTSGKINFGISNTSTAVYSSTDFDPNTTYLLIVEYNVATSGTSNLWVRSMGVPLTKEDAGTPTATVTAAAIANISGVYLRQYNAGQNYTVDGVRVAATWSALLPFVPDLTAPAFVSSYPTISNITGNGAQLNLQLNEPGTVYGVVLPNGATAPTSAQVKALQDANSQPVENSGTVVVAEASVTVSESIGDLVGDTSYDLYLVAEDDEAMPNLQSQPTLVEFTTGPVDNDPPVFQNNTPSYSGVTDVQFNLAIRLNEIGTAYYVILEDGATPPTSNQVMDGFDASNAPAFKSGTVSIAASGQDVVTAITGLSATTSYDVYVVAEDDETSPNVQGVPTLLEVTTDQMRDYDSNVEADGDFVPAEFTVNATDYTSEEAALRGLSFLIVDNGTSDGLPTEVTKMVFVPSASNTAEWADVLGGAYVYSEGKVNPVDPVITNSGITFDFTSDPFIVANNDSRVLEVYFWLKSGGIIDGQIIRFEVSQVADSWESSATGSELVSVLEGAISSAFSIDVEAVELAFEVETSVQLATDFSLTVRAVDENGNVDRAPRFVSISKTAGPESFFTSASGLIEREMENGVFTWSDLQISEPGEYTLEITDGSLTTTVDIEVTPIIGGVFFSEYIEGSSNNKAIEITNASGETVDLSLYTIERYNNGGTAVSGTLLLSTVQSTLAHKETIVIGNPTANASILAVSNITSDITFFNGDDAMLLKLNGEVIDVIGDFGADPGTNWPVAGGLGATSEFTLVRKSNVFKGNPVDLASFGTNADNSEWLVYPQDYSDNLGLHDLQIPGEPVLTVNEVEFDSYFGVRTVGSTFTQSVVLTGINLDGEVFISAPDGYLVSDNDTDYFTELSIEPTDGTLNTPLYIRFAPQTDEEDFIGTITVESLNAFTRTIEVDGYAVSAQSVYFQNFNECLSLNGFTAQSVIGDQVWNCTSSGNANSAVRMNGFAGSAANANEDWLVSPSLDLTGFGGAQLTFESEKTFGGPDLTVWASSNYSGDVTTATWTQLSATVDQIITSGTTSWTKSGKVSLTEFAGATVHVAFKYLSQAGMSADNVAAQWTIDNVYVEGLVPSFEVITADFEGAFGEFYVNEVSSTSSFKMNGFSLAGTDVTITPPAQFEVSETSDFTTVGTSSAPLIISISNGTLTDKEIYVRFAPTDDGDFGGNVTVTTTGYDPVNVPVSGSAIRVLEADDANFDGTFGDQDVNTNSTATSFVVFGAGLTASVSVTPPSQFQVSTSSDFSTSVGTNANPLTLASENGFVDDVTVYVRFSPTSVGEATGDIAIASDGFETITLAVSGNGAGFLDITSTNFNGDFGQQDEGTNSVATSFSINAGGLTANVIVTPPAGYQASLSNAFTSVGTSANPLTVTATSGAIDNVTVFVRFSPSEPGTFNGNVVVSTTGFTSVNLAVSGTGVEVLSIAKELGITVFPNPVADAFRVQNESGKQIRLSLFSVEGARMPLKEVNGAYDISGLNSGLYILVISDERNNQLGSERILKK